MHFLLIYTSHDKLILICNNTFSQPIMVTKITCILYNEMEIKFWAAFKVSYLLLRVNRGNPLFPSGLGQSEAGYAHFRLKSNCCFLVRFTALEKKL